MIRLLTAWGGITVWCQEFLRLYITFFLKLDNVLSNDGTWIFLVMCFTWSLDFHSSFCFSGCVSLVLYVLRVPWVNVYYHCSATEGNVLVLQEPNEYLFIEIRKTLVFCNSCQQTEIRLAATIYLTRYRNTQQVFIETSSVSFKFKALDPQSWQIIYMYFNFKSVVLFIS